MEMIAMLGGLGQPAAAPEVPFYKKPLYWVGVAVVVGATVYHWPKIKRAVGLGAFDPKGFNPTGKLPGARPSPGYSHESNIRREEDRVIARLDDYFAQKREAARQARKAAKRAAKKAAKKGGR